jgi:hypothetical protein
MGTMLRIAGRVLWAMVRCRFGHDPVACGAMVYCRRCYHEVSA